MRHAIRLLLVELRILRDVQRQIESDTTLEPDKARRSVLLAELNTEAREVRDALRVLRAFTEVEDISVGKVEPPAPTLPLEVRPT